MGALGRGLRQRHGSAKTVRQEAPARRTVGLEHRVGAMQGSEGRRWGDQRTERCWLGLHASSSTAPFPGGKLRLSAANSKLTGQGAWGPAPGSRAAWALWVQPPPDSMSLARCDSGSACLGEACLPLLPEPVTSCASAPSAMGQGDQRGHPLTPPAPGQLTKVCPGSVILHPTAFPPRRLWGAQGHPDPPTVPHWVGSVKQRSSARASLMCALPPGVTARGGSQHSRAGRGSSQTPLTKEVSACPPERSRAHNPFPALGWGVGLKGRGAVQPSVHPTACPQGDLPGKGPQPQVRVCLSAHTGPALSQGLILPVAQ